MVVVVLSLTPDPINRINTGLSCTIDKKLEPSNWRTLFLKNVNKRPSAPICKQSTESAYQGVSSHLSRPRPHLSLFLLVKSEDLPTLRSISRLLPAVGPPIWSRTKTIGIPLTVEHKQEDSTNLYIVQYLYGTRWTPRVKWFLRSQWWVSEWSRPLKQTVIGKKTLLV